MLYEVELQIRGRQAKTAVEDRGRRQNRETRQARWKCGPRRVTLRPPWRPDRKLPPVTVNVVLVREPNPPAGETPVEWILITTLPIDTPEQVRTIVEYYCVRWYDRDSVPRPSGLGLRGGTSMLRRFSGSERASARVASGVSHVPCFPPTVLPFRLGYA